MTADPRRPLTHYTSSRNIADLVLTATYSRDMFRSSVHDPGRLALVLGCALLAELVAADRIRIAVDGLVHHRGSVPGPDLAVDAILEDLRREPVPHPAGKWLDYLALEHRSSTLVWRRLVEAGAARPEPARWPRRTPGFALTGLQPTAWARHFLGSAAAMGPALPPAAVILWRALAALLPDRDLDLPAPAVERLATAPLPATMTTLFAALDESLTRLSLHF